MKVMHKEYVAWTIVGPHWVTVCNTAGYLRTRRKWIGVTCLRCLAKRPKKRSAR